MAMDSKKPNINVNNGYNGGLNSAMKSSSSFDPRSKKNQNNKGGAASPQKAVKKKLITEGVKKAAQVYGVPEAATESILNTDTGKEAVDAAASAPTITEGAKDAAKVITKKVFIQSIPLIILPFLFLLLIFIIIFSKDTFGGLGDDTDTYEELRGEITKVVSSYRSKTNVDGNLILATLVAYNDMEDIENEEISSKNMAYMKKQVSKLAEYQIMTTKTCSYDSSTMRKIASNDDLIGEANYNCVSDMEGESYSISIDEGKIDDDNSGGVYYWNLIDEGFIFDYYNDYMINKDDKNSSENDEVISNIISEIYDYYNMMDKQSFIGITSICSNGITVDGVTMNFEDYIKGVVYSELGGKQVPIEALKAQAVAARSVALYVTNNCTRELVNNNVQSYREGHEANPNIAEAVDSTMGQYLSWNEKPFYAAFSTFPPIDGNCNVTCDDSSCSADLYYDWNKKLGSHRVSIPKGLSYFNIEDYVYALTFKGHCTGMSQLGAWYDAESGLTYEEILEKYYSDQVVLTVGATEGLEKDANGFLKRVSRATIDNPYYYANSPDYSNGYIGLGTNEGECAWYAVRRTNEIIATMGLQNEYSYVTSGGNGNGFCYASDYNQFEHSNNPNDPNLKAGSLISWNSSEHSYGHIAVVEAVYRDSNGDITSIDISEAGVSFGNPVKAGLTNSRELWSYNGPDILKKRSLVCEDNGCQNFRNINMNTIKYNFICYLKVVK